MLFFDILEYASTYYMQILPIWFGVILSQSSEENKFTVSNAIAENWFRIVKRTIFETKVNTKAGDFIRECTVILMIEFLYLKLDFTVCLPNI